jgi:hypothetical protein
MARTPAQCSRTRGRWPGDFSQQSIVAWYATRKLWIYERAGHPYLVSGAGAGVADPVWSANGTLILHVRGNGLWLINPRGGPDMRIVGKLFAGAWPNFFGYVDWQDQFAWLN